MNPKIPGRLAIDLTVLILFVVAMNTSATGIPFHEWLSVIAAIVVLVHLLTEWEWTVHVFTRVFRRLARLSRLNLLVDVALFVTFVLVMLSGFLVSQSIVPMLGLRVPFGPTWRVIHALAADFALVVVGVHIGLHWRWFARAFPRVMGRSHTATATGEESA